MSGGFTVFAFDDTDANPSAVYLESLLGGRYLEGDGELTGYRSAFDKLWQLSTAIEEQHP
jgi:hypothetical protein